MKKKFVITALALATAAAIAGCGSKAATTESRAQPTSQEAQSETHPEENAPVAEVTNPMKEVDGAEAFADLNVAMVPMAEAMDVSYFIISDQVAEVQFMLGETTYTWRGSATADDFSGIFEPFEENEETFSGEDGTQITLNTTTSGGKLATWESGEASYTLYAPAPAQSEEVSQTAIALIAANAN